MQDHSLQVGEELVIQGHIRLTILAVEEDEVFLGIIAEPNGMPGLVARPQRLRLMAVPVPLTNDNSCWDALCARLDHGPGLSHAMERCHPRPMDVCLA
jgi:hypothetical protein